MMLQQSEINILTKLLEGGLTTIEKIDPDNNQFEATNGKRLKYAVYLNMQGNPAFGQKGKMFSKLRKGKKYSIKELLNNE